MWALWGFIIGSIVTMVMGGLAGAVYAEIKFSKTMELWYNECHSKNDVL
mgnify:FL=1|jgi:hypothetical protein